MKTPNKVTKLLLITVATLILSALATAQSNNVPGDPACEADKTKCVIVTQEFVDRATQAFKEIVALRALDEANKEALEAQKAATKAKQDVIEAQAELIKIKDQQIARLTEIKCSKASFLLIIYRSKTCY